MTRQKPSSGYGILAETAQGLIDAGEYAYTAKPRYWDYSGTVPPIVYCGGITAGGMNLRGWFAYPYLVQKGFYVASSDYGDTPLTLYGSGLPPSIGGTGNGGPGVWGRDAAQAKVTELVLWMQSSKLLCKSGKVIVMGGSHGTTLALNWAHANPSLTQCVVVGLPAVDPEDIRANNRQGYQVSIETAYTNNAGWQAARPTHCPVDYAASYATHNIPTRLYASTDDPICIYQRVLDFAAQVPSAEVINYGAHSHTLTGVDWLGMADWIESHSAA